MQSGFVATGSQSPRSVTYALAAGLVNIGVSASAEDLTKPEITEVVVADTGGRYALSFPESVLAYDKPVVEITPQGLLQSVNADNDDKTVDVVKKVTEIVVDIAGAAKLEAAGTKKAFAANVLFDPFNGASRDEAAAALDALLPDVTVTVTAIDGSPLPDLAPSEKADPAGCSASVCFRLLTPIRVRMKLDGVVDVTKVVFVPDPRFVAAFNVTRGACVHKISKLNFTNGTLTKVDIDSPSELLGCLAIPADIVKAVIGLPATASANRKAFYDAQKVLAQSQASLLATQQRILEASMAEIASGAAQ